MPKQTHKIEGFHGGLNSNADPRDIREFEAPSLQDVAIDSVGRLKTLGKVDSGTSDSNTTSISKNRGLFVMSSDRKVSDGSISDETLIFLHDNANHTIDVKDSDGWNTAKIDMDDTSLPNYYAADGVVRVSDAGLNENSQWFGYIADERFNGINADSAAIGWYNIEQSLATPTLGKCLISTPHKGSDSNGVNSSSKEYIGEVIDGSAAQSDTSVGNPQVVDHSSVNLRVGVQYNQILPNTASDTTADNGTDSDSKNNPYPFLENNIHIGGSTSDDEYSRLSDTVASGSEFTIDGSSSMAIPLFITSGRQYNDMESILIFFGETNNSNSYYWRISSDEITPDCWNFIVCAEGTHDAQGSGTPPDWGTDFDFWEVRVKRKPTGYDSNDGMIWKMSGPIQVTATTSGFNTGVYTFHYTWLYDAKNKQESLPYQFGDIDTSYSGEHDAADHSTVMTDSGASFIADQLIGRVIKNTTDGSEGIITDNAATTVTVSQLFYGSDNSWDTSGDDDYEILQSNVNKLAIVRNSCLLNFDAYICSNVAAGNAYGLNKRISGSRLYYKVEENDNYFLIGELDFISKGFKWTPEADINSYDMINTTNTSGNILSKTAIVKEISPESPNIVDTFKSINGFSSEVDSLDALYKTAVVHGRRAYIGNIKQTSSGSSKTHPDRILKSQINRFDTFPEGMGGVDVVIRDGESIVKLEAYADRILQFKEHSLYIINVSETVDFLEDTYRNKGCAFDYHVARTDMGIVWFNDHGVYLYDGKNVNDLLEKDGMRLINEDDWSTFIKDGTDDTDMSSALIGYIPKKKQILIKNENNDVYIYDFVLRAWTTGSSKITESTAMTNFALDADQNLFYIDNTTTVRKTWQSSPQSTTTLIYQTPDIDFGQPSVRKKIYRIRISYKGDADNLVIKYGVNGDTDAPYDFEGTNSTTGKPTGSTASSSKPLHDKADLTTWYHAELKPDVSSEANNVYSFQLHMTGEVDSDFEVNDITIIYRMKNVR